MKNYKYRIYPNKTQCKALHSTLHTCQQVYNKCLEQRIALYKDGQQSTTAYNQIAWIKTQDIELSSVHSQVVQNTILRLDNAFKQFFLRCKRGDKPGFPRFKSIDRYNSFCYPQYTTPLKDKSIYLSKIGTVKLRKHRELPDGRIKTCTVSRNSLGHWYVVLAVDEVKSTPAPCQEQSEIGIDLGCQTFATLNDGTKIEHPHYYRASEERLKRAQQRYAKVKHLAKTDKHKRKAKHTLLKFHEKVKNQRTNFLHQTARTLVDQYAVIYHEDLNIKGLTADNYRNLNKSILDSGWGQFIDMLKYKAADAGRRVVAVNPAYTSQICSTCGTLCPKELSCRTHACPKCGLRLDRDVNAAINILRFGANLSTARPYKKPLSSS